VTAPGARHQRTGVLLLRVWLEHDGADAFRARIISMLDVAVGREQVSVASDPQAVLEVVERWLKELTGAVTPR
jgi:hypothetical protein